MLCSSGGHFTRVPGGWEYQGGETRLVSVSNYCHMQELQDALHRVSQTMRLDLSSSSGSVQCPSAFLYILFADLLLFGARNVCHHRQSTHRPHAPGCRFWVPMSAEVTLPCHLICLSDTLVHMAHQSQLPARSINCAADVQHQVSVAWQQQLVCGSDRRRGCEANV